MYIPYFVYPFTCQRALGLFPLLDYCENVAMNIGVQVSESLLSVFLGIYLGVELLDHVVIP